MDVFLNRKRKRSAITLPPAPEEEDTDIKLAILASVSPGYSQDVLLDCLLAHDGDVEETLKALESSQSDTRPPKRPAATGYQSSLAAFAQSTNGPASEPDKPKNLTRKGQTLHLYSPLDVEKHTPCSIIHNFLPAAEADLLLEELLIEVPHFRKDSIQLFDRTVESPHTMALFVDNMDELQEQKDRYSYNGSYIAEVHQTRPEMLRVCKVVATAVNEEIQRRIRDFNPQGKRLKFQSPEAWRPNTSFVNCYDGGKESVGYHTDELTYLGPRAVIGSLSLGVAREFRGRSVVYALHSLLSLSFS
jgi:alkylated DNA repair dioxygenase AlkB